MKIILVNSLANGGGERIAVNIANELIKDDNVILVILEKDIIYNVDKRIEVISINTNTFLNNLIAPLKLKKLIKKNNVTLVQSHLYRSNIVNIISKLIGSKHYVQIVNHGDPLQYHKKGVKGIIMLSLIKFLYPISDQIIVISDAMKQIVENIIFTGKNKVRKINNPSNINEIINLSYEHPNIKIEFEYFVFMGRLIESKNINLLIQAVNELKINLIIIGNGPDELKLKKEIENLNLSKNIIFLGLQKNPFPILKNAKAFISASNSEGFPNAIIESLACSIPVIHSDCISGPREILQPNSTLEYNIKNDTFEVTPYGVLYKTNDLQGLTNSIKYINALSSNDMYNLKTNCFNRAFNFDSSNIVKQYFD